MTSEPSLFGDDPEPAPAAPPAVTATGTTPTWQVDLIRKALDARGLDAMAERQAAVEGLVGRPVASLRELTWPESQAVLAGLSAGPRATSGSSWDDRDEDTWIDRL